MPSADATQPPTVITHLALDTSILVGQGWPHPTVVLDNIVATCQKLGVPVLMPEDALLEVKAECLRQTNAAIEKTRQRVSDLTRRTAGMVDGDAVKWPTRDEVEAGYGSAADALIARWGCAEVPVPEGKLLETVARSARHEPPFPDGDVSFRDSLIVCSLMDHLKAGDVLGLMARDRFFLDARIPLCQ